MYLYVGQIFILYLYLSDEKNIYALSFAPLILLSFTDEYVICGCSENEDPEIKRRPKTEDPENEDQFWVFVFGLRFPGLWPSVFVFRVFIFRTPRDLHG